MKSGRVVRESLNTSDESRNIPGLNPGIFRHSGIWGAADEAVLVNEKNVLFFFDEKLLSTYP